MLNKMLILSITCVLCLLIFGCGQSGPLYLPKEPQKNTQTVSTVDAKNTSTLSSAATKSDKVS